MRTEHQRWTEKVDCSHNLLAKVSIKTALTAGAKDVEKSDKEKVYVLLKRVCSLARC